MFVFHPRVGERNMLLGPSTRARKTAPSAGSWTTTEPIIQDTCCWQPGSVKKLLRRASRRLDHPVARPIRLCHVFRRHARPADSSRPPNLPVCFTRFLMIESPQMMRTPGLDPTLSRQRSARANIPIAPGSRCTHHFRTLAQARCARTIRKRARGAVNANNKATDRRITR